MGSICEKVEVQAQDPFHDRLRNVLVLFSSARSPFFSFFLSKKLHHSPGEHAEVSALPAPLFGFTLFLVKQKCYWVLKHALLTDTLYFFALARFFVIGVVMVVSLIIELGTGFGLGILSDALRDASVV